MLVAPADQLLDSDSSNGYRGEQETDFERVRLTRHRRGPARRLLNSRPDLLLDGSKAGNIVGVAPQRLLELALDDRVEAAGPVTPLGDSASVTRFAPVPPPQRSTEQVTRRQP